MPSITSIPSELTAKIFAELSIQDTQNTGVAHENLAKHAVDRENPIHYLRGVFNEPEQLLDAMARSGTYMSGPMTMEYFVPGSYSGVPVWNFHVSSSYPSVVHIMKHMELSGVEWATLVGRITRMLQVGTGSMCVTGQQTLSLLNSQILRSAVLSHCTGLAIDTRKFPATEEGFKEVKDHAGVWTNSSLVISMRDHVFSIFKSNQHDNDCTTIFADYVGYIVARGTTHRVNLVSEYRSHHFELSSVISFPSTCLHCFISPFCAAHLQREFCSSNRWYTWPENERHLCGVRVTKEELGSRCESVNKCDLPPLGTYRTAGDRRSCVVHYSYNTSLTSEAQKLVCDSVLSTTWYEYPARTKLMPSLLAYADDPKRNAQLIALAQGMSNDDDDYMQRHSVPRESRALE